jgi:G6PDH family F420-dependent oxidoreductase
MAEYGYTLMCEQRGPRELVGDAEAAEEAGFDFAVVSDHYFPWLRSQGHSPNAWALLGAVAEATERLPLMTYVTCPIMRYHPVVVAQQAATVHLLSNGRFTLGLGAGENLNEHVLGRGWPPVNRRHEMLEEAVQIIRRLFESEHEASFEGRHFAMDSARLWDRPEHQLPIGIAVSGEQSCSLAGRYADMMIAVEPESRLGELFDAAGGTGKPRVGQVPICWAPDRDEAIRTAHEQFRWFGGGWKVNAELPGPDAFAAATRFVTPADVADAISCGPDAGAHVSAVAEFLKAGFTHVAVVQIGGESQPEFVRFAETELLPALREL